MSSNVLAGPSSGTNFPQQGAVDWVALSKSTLSFSVEVVSRFSKAGVELITVAVGQAIFSGLNVPPDGQRRLTDAISKLKAFASYGDVLWFGFGVKHITRVLCETEQGATCVAICACLSVSYDNGFASKVLKASTDLTKTPGALTPALSQWNALMVVCAGALADSQFPILVEGFSRLIGGSNQGLALQPIHTTTTATALAGAIQELSKVSNGSLRNVTFRGGKDCGWLAAVAQWLLSLRVEIISDTGVSMYSNFLPNEYHAQVIIIQQMTTTGNLEGTVISRKSYFVPPGTSIIHLYSDRAWIPSTHQHMYSPGRSEWNNILRQTFGSAADELLHPRNVDSLAAFLCSASPHPLDSKIKDLNPWGESYLYSCHQRRRAFMSFASTRLPELATVAASAEMHGYQYRLGTSSPDLDIVCSCGACSGQNSEGFSFCLRQIGVSIVKYLGILSWLDIEPSVKPSPNGLLMIYYNYYFSKENPEVIKSDGLGLSVFPFSLFTGTLADRIPIEANSAYVGAGICIYYASLQDPNISPSRSLRLRVVLGQIERDTSLYEVIKDKWFTRNMAKVYSYLPHSVSKLGPRTQLLLVIDETLDRFSLDASFYIDTNPIAIQVKGILSHSQYTNNADKNGALSQEMFGVCEMRKRIIRRMALYPCRQQNVQIVPVEVLEQSLHTWTGLCSDAHGVLCHNTDQECLASSPKQGEWTIVGKVLNRESQNESDRCFTMLLRGGYPLLYSVLCYLDNPRCQITLRHDDEVRVLDNNLDFLGYIRVYSMKEEQPCIFEFSRRTITFIDPPPISQSPSLSSSYHNKTKSELEALLKRRGIRFMRTSKKQILIQQLQKYDEENPVASGDEEEWFDVDTSEEEV